MGPSLVFSWFCVSLCYFEWNRTNQPTNQPINQRTIFHYYYYYYYHFWIVDNKAQKQRRYNTETVDERNPTNHDHSY